MHQILMTGVRGRNKSPGQFRNVQVEIGSSGRFIPPPGAEVDRLMGDLEKYINVTDSGLDPLVRCYLIHYQFESIHPFADGNGRVGRALISLMTYKWLDHFMPWLYMSAFFERYKDEYISNLFNVSSKGDWSAWIEFCLRGTIQQANDSISRCHKFKRLREDYLKRMTSHSPRTCQIIEHLFTSPVVTIPILASRYDINYRTAQSDIMRLVQVGILTEIENARPRTFFSREIMGIAYSENSIDEAQTSINAKTTLSSQPVGQSQPAA
jgi:Fic family protein